MKNLALFFLVASAGVAGCSTLTTQQQFNAAAQYGRTAVVKKLLADGVEPGGKDSPYDVIFLADIYGHRDIVELMVNRCREIYVHGKNCQATACWVAGKGNSALLSDFLAKGLEANGVTLGCAASGGNAANVRLLIERGADVDAAISGLDDSIAQLSTIDNPSARTEIAKMNGGRSLLERLRPGGKAAASSAVGGVSKAEMEQIVKAAMTTTKAAPTPAAATEIQSDVDHPAYKVAQNPDAFAVVVGVEKYNALPEARFAERDAKAMNAHLLAMGYPQRNIVLLTGPQATRTGFVKNLEAWLPNRVTERSTVLFYFSGHGAPDANTSEAYLVPLDGDPQYLEETAYPIKRLYEKLSVLKAKRVLVVLDSCFSGAGGRSVLAQGMRPLVTKLNLAPTKGKVVSLAASASEEITGALEEQGHGLFTYHLLKALTETAGRGSVAELYTALKPRLQDEARRQNRTQTPQVFGGTLDVGLR